jgi:epoxyqueuosine reductase
MVSEKTKEKLFSELQACGYAARVVSIQRLHDLEHDINSQYENGMFEAEFYQEELAHFDFNPPDEMPDAKSIIIVSIPKPQNGVVVHWNGESRTLIIPPIYVGYDALPARVERVVNEILNPLGYRALKTLKFPIKPLAVHSGLAKYGRNNIAYVEGMGSFLQLFTFYSDMPCEEDDWGEMKMLERCKNCWACIIQCPTGAISEDRFLLHAERCLSFHNEKPADVPFPAWIDPAWHNSVYGCMVCQRYCPEDKKFKDWVVTLVEFSQEETTLLLNGSSREQMPAATLEKLGRFERSAGSLDTLPRNLGVLLNKKTN